MFRQRISGADVALRPETSVAEAFGDASLVHLRFKNFRGVGIYESSWTPSPEELSALLLGGSLIIAAAEVPVVLAAYVDPPEMAEQGTVQGNAQRWIASEQAITRLLGPHSLLEVTHLLAFLCAQLMIEAKRRLCLPIVCYEFMKRSAVIDYAKSAADIVNK